MKKLLFALLAMLLVLTASALAEKETLPDEIAELFDVPAWEDYHVMTNSFGEQSWLYSEALDAGVVVMSDGALQIVCIVEPDKNGNLRITHRNYTMVTTDEGPTVELGMGTTTQELAAPWSERWMFELFTSGYYIAFGKFDNGWRVKTVLNNATEVLSFVDNDWIGYSEGVEHGDYVELGRDMKYVYGTYDNRFTSFNIYTFPKTIEEARAKLTNPPVTPTDFYAPQTVTLRTNEKYDVFAAPGRDSYRAANGKAVMSTNDWVQIFGEEDGWLLVQYDISSDRMRFGYIDASALPKNADVPELHWFTLPEQTINANTFVTDDPLNSCVAICQLSAGDKVRVLASFDNWYYIEITNEYGQLLRGFVPMSCISIVSEDDMVG